jgi:hypothetical protein
MERPVHGPSGLNDRPDETEHRQVWIEHDGQSAQVDEGIAGLILALWREGFRTTGSCQAVTGDDGSSWAWITFETAEEAKAFARLSGGTVLGRDSEVARQAPYYVNKGVLFPTHQIHEVKRVLRKRRN